MSLLDMPEPSSPREFTRSLIGALPVPATEIRAYCFSDGVIFFDADVPSGAVELVHGHPVVVREFLADVASPGFRPGVMLVPGMADADDTRQADVALSRWLISCANSNTPGLTWNTARRVSL